MKLRAIFWNLQDFKSIGGRINSFTAAANGSSSSSSSSNNSGRAPNVAESKLDESMDTNLDVTESRSLGAGALAGAGAGAGGLAGYKDGPLTPVRGAARQEGDELTPVSSAASARSINGGSSSSPMALPLQDTTAEEDGRGGEPGRQRRLRDP